MKQLKTQLSSLGAEDEDEAEEIQQRITQMVSRAVTAHQFSTVLCYRDHKLLSIKPTFNYKKVRASGERKNKIKSNRAKSLSF